MVFHTKILFAANTIKKSKRVLSRNFIDSLRLYVRGGAGGNGFPKHGGIGGKGGDIYVVAKEDAKLKKVVQKYPTKRIVAGSGEHSQPKKLLGGPGCDAVVEVPVGVTVFDEFRRSLGDLNKSDDKLLVARGGPGGTPLTHFLGMRGNSSTVVLDLKIIADVGLVGFPNAGKSSLLKAISRARPKIASYPFTTIEPNIGVLEYNDLRQITMADLPGLIEGAHANIGLGHRFLKHVERTKLILIVIDINGFQLSPKYQYRSPLETVVLLNKEMEMYQEDLLRKPILLAVNKMDTPGAQRKWQELNERLLDFENVVADFPEEIRPLRPIKFMDVFTISVLASDKSVLEMKERLRNILDVQAEKETENEEINLRQLMKLKMIESGRSMI